MEKFKDVEIKGRKFRLTKINARTGSFMATKVIGILTPLIQNLNLKEIKAENDIEKIDITKAMKGLTSLEEREFHYIQDNCLKLCYELLSAGPAKVLNDDCTFGVEGLEDDTMTVMALTVHALVFNVKGFFDGSPLSSIAGGILTTFLHG